MMRAFSNSPSDTLLRRCVLTSGATSPRLAMEARWCRIQINIARTYRAFLCCAAG